MGEFIVGRTTDIPEGKGLVVEIGGKSIGVFKVDGEYLALRNSCPHQGGPACGGGLFPTVKAKVLPSGRMKEYFDYDQMVVCCPWHGWEFDVKTGRCLADTSRRLATYETKVENDQVVIILP